MGSVVAWNRDTLSKACLRRKDVSIEPMPRWFPAPWPGPCGAAAGRRGTRNFWARPREFRVMLFFVILNGSHSQSALRAGDGGHRPITKGPLRVSWVEVSPVVVSTRSGAPVPSPTQTAALIAQVQAGDPAAFAEIVRAFLRPAYAVALAIVGRPADAEDVAQDSLLRAFERIGSCREPERFGGWLLKIVRNESRNFVRSRRLRDVSRHAPLEEPAGQGPSPDEAVIRGELLLALAAVSEVQREVVLLHDLEGWTHGQISEALGCSETQSRQHLFQARRKLRALLGGDEQPGGGSRELGGWGGSEEAPGHARARQGAGGTS